MSEQREVLTAAIRDVTDQWDEPLDEVHDVPQIVNAVLAAGFRKVDTVKTLAEVLATHRVNYHHRNVGPEPITADNLRYTSCDGCDWLGGHRDEAGWERHLATLLTTLSAPTTAAGDDGEGVGA